ncbi:hypothetical protein D3C81_1210570 [compost metagenome]
MDLGQNRTLTLRAKLHSQLSGRKSKRAELLLIGDQGVLIIGFGQAGITFVKMSLILIHPFQDLIGYRLDLLQIVAKDLNGKLAAAHTPAHAGHLFPGSVRHLKLQILDQFLLHIFKILDVFLIDHIEQGGVGRTGTKRIGASN